VVAERGATRLLADDIPATLADLLTARLDATGDAKEIAQVASIFGRQFVYRVLREVAATSDEELSASLRKLVEADLILASGAPPDARYVFKHALVRDVAYESLLRSRRRALHNAAARGTWRSIRAGDARLPSWRCRQPGSGQPRLATGGRF